ncbi:MAG: hydrogenase iron-sulfur subunit [Candidatus Bathyarchaeota archaeon]|nr:MAG: hydrogenase iron-sulfur subunit [Candidatus Bathyarchaeota archaeon]
MTKSEFQPRIVGFLCNWCSYAGADLAGVSRIQYPPTLRIVRVMCSGRIHPALILEAFRSGADGVLVAGCHLGDCHYISGNYKTQNRVLMLKKVLEQLGLEPERLRLEWVSASEGDRFAKVVKDMTEEMKKLGPSPLRNGG